MQIERINRRYVKNLISFGFGVEKSSQLEPIAYNRFKITCWHAKIFFWHWIWLIDMSKKELL